MMDMNKRKVVRVVIGMLAVCLLAVYIPTRRARQQVSVCRVEAASCYELPLPEGDTLYLPLQTDRFPYAALCANPVSDTTNLTGVFVSRAGHCLTTDSVVHSQPDSLAGKELLQRLQRADSLLQIMSDYRKSQLEELDDYARSHSVVDDGYNEVMTYRVRVSSELSACDSVKKRLQKVLNNPAIYRNRACARLRLRAQLTSVADSLRYAAHAVVRSGPLVLLQLDAKALPEGVSYFSVYRMGTYAYASKLFAFNDLGGPTATLHPHYLEPDDTLFAAAEGGAWVNASGQLCGIRHGAYRISSLQVASLLAQVHSWPMWWLYNFKGLLAPLSAASSLSEGKFKSASRLAVPCYRYALTDSLVYEGQAQAGARKGRMLRMGYGRMRSVAGVLYEGWWNADTLVCGQRIDSTGFYKGGFDSQCRPLGQGMLYMPDGAYYQGEWNAGKRHGHGFSSKQGQLVRCGEWRSGLFVGERMVYTPDRVYGIDISRHQHEKGRRRYRINWDQLRITSLGPGRRVSGTVNYPVSFVYIKSTEGTTIFNRYYPADRREAMRRGMAVGSYHFFSTRSSGVAQATYFLRRSVVGKLDLPSVLDVEPSESQIRRMGGDEKLFKEVYNWLQVVEKRTGVRPILYVSQQFVNNHLSRAPQALRNYDVWIARYGQFKPYVRLLHWQLTPFGRVKGITGEVDINVYNGTREQFDHYLRQLRHME